MKYRVFLIYRFDAAINCLSEQCELCVVAIAPCLSDPCQNGATCHTTNGDKYTCHCKAGYTGQNCESKNTEFILLISVFGRLCIIRMLVICF